MAAEYQIPKTHKAAVYDNPGTVSIKIEDVETPEPGPGEVLVHLSVASASYLTCLFTVHGQKFQS